MCFREAKPHSKTKKLWDFIPNFGSISSASCNATGTKVAITCLKVVSVMLFIYFFAILKYVMSLLKNLLFVRVSCDFFGWFCFFGYFLSLKTIIYSRGVVVSLRALERKLWSSKFCRNTTGIPQEGHPEFEVLRCSSTKSGSKASV